MASETPSQISNQPPQALSPSSMNSADSMKASPKTETITTTASPRKGESLTTAIMNAAANSSDSNPSIKVEEPSKASSPKQASSTTTTTTTTTTADAATSKSPLSAEEPKSSSTTTNTAKASPSEEQTVPSQPQKQGEEKVNNAAAATSPPSQQVKEQQQQQQPPPSQNVPQQESPPLQQTSANVVDRALVDVVVPPTEQQHKQEGDKVAANGKEAQMGEDLSASEANQEIAKPEESKAEEPKAGNDEVKQKEVKFADGVEIKPEESEMEESSSSREQTTLLSDLKEYERKALLELKSKIEEAVLLNKFFDSEDAKPTDQAKATETTNNNEQQEKQDLKKEEEEEEESSKTTSQEGEKTTAEAVKESKGKEIMIDDQNVSNPATEKEPEDSLKPDEKMKNKELGIVDKEISLWGAPLMPSKGNASTDVILLKFLRAREFRVDEAFDMLKNTLKWRKENNIDSILDEQDPQTDILDPVVSMEGIDREGNPICYNVYGLLGFDKSADKLLGDEEKRERFLRWRIRKMEKSVKEDLDFNPGGSCEILQINDLKNTPLPTKKEVRLATRRGVELLQDNYPEFVSKNIFINVPLWYYAFNTVLSPFLTPRTKNKFIQARTSKVTEVLLKYIAAEQLPVRYGGLKMDKDPDFDTEDEGKETWVKAGSSEIIEIPAPEGGKTMVWDLTVSTWEVSYKEEFVPSDERSYTVIVQKTKKITWQEGTIRNSFRNAEPGKILLTIDNPSFKKKRILYRHKAKNNV